MVNTIQFCVDRIITGIPNVEAQMKIDAEIIARTQISDRPGDISAAVDIRKLWCSGRTLRVRFLEGDPAVHRRIAAVAGEWSQYANITFAFSDEPDAEIRISFQPTGSWSTIGTDALLVPSTEPTMNYGWLQPDSDDDEYRRVVLHEFGHALGLIHEHQQPGHGGIPWNEQAVLDYYMGPPNFWSEAEVRSNVLNKYNRQHTKYTDFDRYSIMLYPVPAKLTLGGFAVPWMNKEFSELDKRFVAEVYPF